MRSDFQLVYIFLLCEHFRTHAAARYQGIATSAEVTHRGHFVKWSPHSTVGYPTLPPLSPHTVSPHSQTSREWGGVAGVQTRPKAENVKKQHANVWPGRNLVNIFQSHTKGTLRLFCTICNMSNRFPNCHNVGGYGNSWVLQCGQAESPLGRSTTPPACRLSLP